MRRSVLETSYRKVGTTVVPWLGWLLRSNVDASRQVGVKDICGKEFDDVSADINPFGLIGRNIR